MDISTARSSLSRLITRLRSSRESIRSPHFVWTFILSSFFVGIIVIFGGGYWVYQQTLSINESIITSQPSQKLPLNIEEVRQVLESYRTKKNTLEQLRTEKPEYPFPGKTASVLLPSNTSSSTGASTSENREM